MTLESNAHDYQPSPRMKNALRADQVMKCTDRKEGDHLLTVSMPDPRDWTENLARQLSMDIRSQDGVHDTLLVLVPLLDDLLRAWPPPRTPADCRPMAEAATRNLSPLEVYTTFLAGPGRWRQKRVPNGITISGLPTALQPILTSELASELSRMLDQWARWDIPQLRDRWKEAVKDREEAHRAEEATSRAVQAVHKRRTSEEIAALRSDNPVSTYQPPRERV